MPNTSGSLTETRLAAALRGGTPLSPPRDEWRSLLDAAGDHGVLPLLADAAANARWDQELLAEMRPALVGPTYSNRG